MKVSNLCFSYDNRTVFENYSVEIGEGITCLMGASGLGKTTLLKLLAGLLSPEKGIVDIDGRKVSFMFQEDRLLPWLSARDNVLLVTDRERETDELLCELGMARRVALARCLMFEADLLLMDEPFKGMDSDLIIKVAEIIKRQNKTAIISTHSLEEAKALDAEVITL